MKKILIIASIVVVATMAKAATYNWSASAVRLFEYGTSTLFSGEVSIYLASSNSGNDVLLETFDITGGLINSATATFTTSDTLTVQDTDYSFYLQYVSNGYTFTSDPVIAQVDALSGTTVNFSYLGLATQNSANWTSQAVPEPTSGLLLLCGLAGLALRRKRV